MINHRIKKSKFTLTIADVIVGTTVTKRPTCDVIGMEDGI